MTGRLNKVDLVPDLLLLALYHSGGEADLGEILSALKEIDTSPFVFDTAYQDDGETTALDEFSQDVTMFQNLGFIDVCDSTGKLADRGETMAAILEDCLEPDQSEALGEVITS